MNRVFRGTVVNALNFGELQIAPDTLVGVDSDGLIVFVEKNVDRAAVAARYPAFFDGTTSVYVDLGERFICPGLIDAHCHGPQYRNAGTGTDLPLLEWLERYTFPTEAKFSSLDYAREVYTKSVKATVRNGTTTCCYFATIHAQATMLFADIVAELGQRAFVGKVCMDRNAPPTYIEASAAQSLADTRTVIDHIAAIRKPTVNAVLTPRFVPTCTPALMRGLSKIAKEHDALIQSHISENRNEIAWVRDLHKDCSSYAAVYDTHGLLTPKTILAHGVYLEDAEIALLRERRSAIVHCPNSNFTIRSGICNVRRLIANGVTVALGTDVSGGYSASLFDTMRNAIVASTALHFTDDSVQPLCYKEAFYLATMGGARALSLDDKIGSIVVGKQFDAIVLDPNAPSSVVDVFEQQSVQDVFQKLFFLADDRNVVQVFVCGKSIK